MKSTVTALSLMLASICVAITAFAGERDTAFECPDDKALKLLELAYNARFPRQSLKNSVGTLSYVIENANRPMDEAALRSACHGLAKVSYWDEHYDAGSNPYGLIPPKEAVSSLRNKHPILSKCSDHSLHGAQHPIRRTDYVPPEEAVRLGISGWVDLELNINDDGIVESARIVDSSNAILERGVVDHVRTFRYPMSTHRIGYRMVRKGLQIRITTDYFLIAREKGCVWNDPRH